MEPGGAWDTVELLDEDGRSIGSLGKREAHEAPGRLHRGFSVFLFDEAGRLLLQRRAVSKYHFGGRWSNSCCSHPPPGADAVIAAQRRVQLELGVNATLQAVGSFRYMAADETSPLVEREDDTVLVGYVRGDVTIAADPDEVSDVRFVALDDLRRDLDTSPGDFTPWFAVGLEHVLRAGHPTQGDRTEGAPP